MARLTIENMGGIVVNVQPGQTVLQGLQAAGLDWMHACGAKGRCTTCRLIITHNQQNTAPDTPAEERYRQLNRLKPNERLTCQVQLLGDITGRVPEQTKLPHMNYSL